MPPAAGAVNQSDLSDARQRAEAAREAADAAQAEADALTAEVETLDRQVASTESRIAELRAEIVGVSADREKLEEEIAALENAIAVKQDEIAATQAELDERNRVLAERACTTYKQGDWYFLEVLLSADDLPDLIARTSFVQLVMEQDEEVATELAGLRTTLEEKETQLERDLSAVETKRAEVLAEEKRLEILRDGERRELDSQEAALGKKESLLEDSEENAARLRAQAEAEERESERIEAELRAGASSGSGIYNGVMEWPVPGFYRISSPYGWRIHPIFGNRRFHTGIDIGRAEDGTPIGGATIVAAEAGEVFFAGSKGGYGNTVMIDHGDGIVTLYAHQPYGGIKVGVGEIVIRGQAIGTVGSTGYSTGPHLHFEVRINGTHVDPMPYLR